MTQKSQRGKVWVVALFVLLSAASCGKPGDSILTVVHEQLKRYPDMEASDFYKLLYQGAMGNEHILGDSAGAHLYLLEELDEIHPDSSEPLIERITPDGNVVRMNLRPFKAHNGNAEALFKAMLNSARRFRPSRDRLLKWWTELSKEAEYGTIPADPGTLRAFIEARRVEGYPWGEHSETYESSYKPSYRVLLRDEAVAVKYR